MSPGGRAEADCRELFRIFVRVTEANGDDTMPDERHELAQALATKIFSHAITAIHLRKGAPVIAGALPFMDSSSIHVIVRSAMEATLLFSYLYDSRENENEKQLRFDAWKLNERIAQEESSSHLETPPEYEREALRNQQDIVSARASLHQNPAFTMHPQKQQEAILRGDWRRPGWRKLGVEMGLGERHAESFYNLLCSHAHSGYHSLRQIGIGNSELQLRLSDAAVMLLAVCQAFAIKMYCEFLPKPQAALKSDPNAEALVMHWVAVGKDKIPVAAENRAV